MLTITKPELHQLQLIDAETDQARIERAEWQRAIEDDLRALQDYVHDHQLIVWHPGEGNANAGKAQEVHLTTGDSCTCQRFKLWERCQHVAFVRKLEAADMLPGKQKPVSAREVK